MNFTSNKKAIWINPEEPKLIWEDELKETDEIVDLTPTPITDEIYTSLKETLMNEEYDSYYDTIYSSGQSQEFRDKVVEEKYDEYYEIVMADDTIIDKEAAINEMIDEETDRRIQAYVEYIITEEVYKTVGKIEEENEEKEELKSQASPANIETLLVDNDKDDEMFISSIKYLPDFLQTKPVFQDATKLLDILVNKKEFESIIDAIKQTCAEEIAAATSIQEKKAIQEKYDKKIKELNESYEKTLQPIYEAYCDTLYKWPGYSRLSYGAKITLLQEKGFSYLLNLLLHMYDEDYKELSAQYDAGEITEIPTYDEFVKQQADSALTKMTMLFNLLYVLKGKTAGLELALDLAFELDPKTHKGKKPNSITYTYISWEIKAEDKGQCDSFDDLPLPGGDVEVKKGDCYYVPEDGLYYIFNGVSWHGTESYIEYTELREPFTAYLNIYGAASKDLQKHIKEFVRSYMLPDIQVMMQFSERMPDVYAYASGDIKLLSSFDYEDYYDKNQHIQHNLHHTVSDEGWMYSDFFDRETIKFGIPIYDKDTKAYTGSVNLRKSYVEDPGGNRYSMYLDTPFISHYITGDAVDLIQDDATITNYDGKYLQAPLDKSIEIDIVTGDQKNAYWEDGVFYRDTLIEYYQFLTVDAIHLAKTIEQMEQILIEDFYKKFNYEVYLGRQTKVECSSGYDETKSEARKQAIIEQATIELRNEGVLTSTINHFLELYNITITNDDLYWVTSAQNEMNEMLEATPNLSKLITYPPFFEFTTTEPEIRELTDVEGPYHLVYSGVSVNNKYTGIGDLGILGSNSYYIYNGLLFFNDNEGLVQIDEGDNWTDIGASHAISDTYYTPAIKGGNLYILHDRELTLLDGTGGWSAITGYTNEFYTTFGIKNGQLYRIYLDLDTIVYDLFDEDNTWTYITGSAYSATYEAYGIKAGVLYKISTNAITPIKYNGQPLTGWDSSFDCVSRYHHCNDDYVTYGICSSKLYAIKNETVTLLDDQKQWTKICGYYNDNSPRTFAYAVGDGKLYELQGNRPQDVVPKDETRTWDDIHGCTTSTVTYCLGLSDGHVYLINGSANTPRLLDEEGGWSQIFGRYTTSTAESQNCYGYGIKNGKLFSLKDGLRSLSGYWLLEGNSRVLDLEEYNISEIKCNLPDGTVLNSIDEIKAGAPFPDTEVSDYDIYVTYNTTGFNNFERYNVKTEVAYENYYYIHPSECRENIYENYCYDLFNPNTGEYSKFIVNNVEVIGVKGIISGDGTATRFKDEQSYIVLPEIVDYNEASFKVTCEPSEGLYPITSDEEYKTGVYCGKYNGDYGIFLKYDNNGTPTYTYILELGVNEEKTFYITYKEDDLYINANKVFESTSNLKVYLPKYLGYDGTDYSEATIYLANSYIKGEERLDLYEKGHYLSLETWSQDVDLCIKTDDSQANQKVIEVIGKDTIEFSMDKTYTMMKPRCIVGNLTVSTDFNFNKLQQEEYEGESKATLVYDGAYELDPDYIESNIPLDDVCDFSNTGWATNLNGDDKVQFKLSTSFTDPIYIKTNSELSDYQKLYKTEENEAYTNKYLLQSNMETDYDCNTTSRGIVYEIVTNQPQTVSRTLVFNRDYFEVDNDKITDYYPYDLNSNKATLTFEPDPGNDRYCKIKIANDSVVKIESETENEKFACFDEIELSTHGSKYYKFNIEKTYDRINDTILTAYEPVSPEKDKLQYEDGKCWNFSNISYFEINPFNSLVLCIQTDDDASKDQGIFGDSNYGLCIRDNEFCYYDNDLIRSVYIAYDNTTYYFKFEKIDETYNVSISLDGEYWDIIFENVHVGNIIGYSKTDHGIISFNGLVDLCESYTNERLYIMNQTTIISTSNDNETYTELTTLNTDHRVDTLRMGYDFTGILDLYESNLLKDKTLDWTEDEILIDRAIKNTIQESDPEYDPDTDPNVYTIAEYGIHLNHEPKRWDTINITYTTVDKAYYMEPDTEYQLKMEVIDDRESGISSVEIIDNPTFITGIVSDFNNGYCEYELGNGYIVLNLNITSLDDQSICGYVYEDEEEKLYDRSQSIYVKNQKVYYYDDHESHELFDLELGELYIKLYTDSNFIEYSLDGESWIKTDVEAAFTQYATFTLGIGYYPETGEFNYFKGEIDLSKSFFNDGLNKFLFTYYKKVIPYIYDGEWHNLTLEPLLTVKDYVVFANAVDFSIDMLESELCPDTERGWFANQMSIYKDGELYDTIIRDSLEIDPSWEVVNERVKVNPDDLYCHIEEEKIRIGCRIILDYTTWFLFRKRNEVYNFKLTYVDDLVYITYNENGKEQILYITEAANQTPDMLPITIGEVEDLTNGELEELLIPEFEKYKPNPLPGSNFRINVGFEFNGTLSVIKSTRGGMRLCDYKLWYTYKILYKKYDEENWTLWDQFLLEKSNLLYQRIGFDLLGTHYLKTSYMKIANTLNAFVTYYNPEWIIPVGSVVFSPDDEGIVTSYDEDSYLQVVMDKITDGWTIHFETNTLSDISNQAVSTFVKEHNGHFQTPDVEKMMPLSVEEADKMSLQSLESLLIQQFEEYRIKTVPGTTLNKLKRNCNYLIEYLFGVSDLTVEKVDRMLNCVLESHYIRDFEVEENKVKVRIMRYEVGGNYIRKKEQAHQIIIIPVNSTKKEGKEGYYITTPKQASKIKVYYRLLTSSTWQHIDDVTWYEIPLEQQDIQYFNKELNGIYIAPIMFGFLDDENMNPDNVEVYQGDVIEFKVVGNNTTYNRLIPYNDIMHIQGIVI